jgi:hypothetical protein
MSLEGDRRELDVTSNLELLVTFGMSLDGVCYVLYTKSHYKLIPNLEVTKKFLENLPSGMQSYNNMFYSLRQISKLKGKIH